MKVLRYPDEYIRYPRPWIFLAGGTITGWRDQLEFPDIEGSVIDPISSVYSPEENTRWEMLALWSSDILVWWFEEGTDQPLSLFELGAHTANYLMSPTTSPVPIIGIDPKYSKKTAVVHQIKALNDSISDYTKIPIVYSLEDLSDLIKERVREIEGNVHNNPICMICHKTIPCDHVISMNFGRKKKE